MPPASNCILLLMLLSTISWQLLPCPILERTQISSCLSSIFLRFFLNASAPGVIYNNTDIILPLDPPDTLQRLFQSFTSRYPLTKNFPFSPVVRHTKMKKSTKGSFLVSTIAHTIYLTTTCVGGSP